MATSRTASIDDVCDYVIERLVEAGGDLSLLKLQKILYYIQAWHLAFHRKPLFDGRFQAWVHGPVNRDIYDRFAKTKMLYSTLEASDISKGYTPKKLPVGVRRHINEVLDIYGKYSGNQLEELSHREGPWITARSGLKASERCDVEIDESEIARYYGKKVGTVR